jgi:polygalacturonase
MSVSVFSPPFQVVRNWLDESCSKATECRPRLLGVIDSENVTIKGPSFFDPAYWCIHVSGSRGVSIHNITIRGDWEVPNNDGIDIDSSEEVVVRCVYISVDSVIPSQNTI